MHSTNTMVMAGLGALVIGAAGFFFGRHADIRWDRQWINGGPMMGSQRGYGMGGHMGYGGKGSRGMGAAGEITAINGNKVTVNIGDDTTKEFTLTDEASVNMMAKGSVTDLKVGQTILVGRGGFRNDTQTVIVRPE